MDLSRVFRRNVIRSALSSLIIIFPLVTGYWQALPLWSQVILLLSFAVINFGLVYYDYKRPRPDVEGLLETLVKSFWGPAQIPHFRANAMLYEPKRGKLKIRYRYNMRGAVDRGFEVEPGVGCAGNAFKEKKLFVVNLTVSTHEKYRIDPSRVWPRMKSIASVPIFRGDQVIGVLTVDSDLKFEEAFPAEDHERIFITMNAFSDMVGELLG